MKKTVAFILSFAIVSVFSVYSLQASPKIMNYTKDGKKVHDAQKDGKKVNSCNYCHKDAAIEKKKGGFLKGEANFATISKNALCAGSGCH